MELARQIDLSIHNPIWAQVREAAPWEMAPARGEEMSEEEALL